MAPSNRPEHQLNLNYLPQLGSNTTQPRSGSSTAATSPVEPPSGTPAKSPFGSVPAMNAASATAARRSAGSPSHELGGSAGGRLYSKRAREIQAQEGVAPQVWGPPTSGNSTPLRETIPESPTGDSFPAFDADVPTEAAGLSSSRSRTRAGTLPSRFSPAAGLNGLTAQSSLIPKTSRPTPSTSPFKPGSHTPTDATGFLNSTAATDSRSALLSRLRAGSMPQQRLLPTRTSAFASSLFSPGWTSNRERSSTLASIRSSDAPSSPAQSSNSIMLDGDVKTLDYLGLVDTPQNRNTLAPSDMEMMLATQRQNGGLSAQQIANLASLNNNANRFRSYSVNAKEKYADDEDALLYGSYSGTMTPADGDAAAAEIHEQIRLHNLQVQAFANYASSSRPRARTVGVLETPPQGLGRGFFPGSSRLESSINAADLRDDSQYSGLAEAVQNLKLGHTGFGASMEEHGTEAPTRALWLGNIPASTTVSSLTMIFGNYGDIESARVLTHKNCGFVNFRTVDDAMNAKLNLHGKEIFPGAGPVRIGYAKVPSASGTPNDNGIFPSQSPDPHAKGTFKEDVQATEGAAGGPLNGLEVQAPAAPPLTPALVDIQGEIVDIVKELGATSEEQARIAQNVRVAVELNDYSAEIPAVSEPSHNRIHDAPRLREIRKRIDNNTCSMAEVEDIAMNMLPEIAELSSDYLGNTVVQKLFEACSDEIRVAMLTEIAPHLAEIGVHKNGTWAAQKIIDMSRTPQLQSMVVDSLRQYSVALFLDQFGNYVMQGCLRYQSPLNNFIFDSMLSRLWELAQGRFGARAMRACLESHYATKDQQRMIAANIALHSVQLATNANGALLLTWFLDTCTFPRRRSVLAPRLVPHLVHLCTHKVAYLTVLKIINQRNEPEARDIVLQALFFSENDQVLTDILSDQTCGATLIFKVLTTPFFDEKIRSDVAANVRNVLLKIKAQPQQGYKRLMDEVGLSTRTGGSGMRDQSRDAMDRQSRPGTMNGQPSQSSLDTSMQRPFYPPMGPGSAPGFETNLQRTNSMESSSTLDYPGTMPMHNGMGGMSPMAYTPSPTGAIPMQQYPQQMQYQQAMLAQQQQQQQQQNGTRQGYYPPLNGQMNGYAGMQMDAYRSMSAGSPMGQGMVPPQNGYAAQGYSPMMAGQMPGQWSGSPQGYSMGGYVGVQPQIQQAGGMRRGRR